MRARGDRYRKERGGTETGESVGTQGGRGREGCSWFTVHDSQFTVHDSQFTVHGSRFTVVALV